MSVPASRLLERVLRAELKPDPTRVTLLLATGGPPLGGADANAYANVIVEGEAVKAPRLAGSTVPAEGGPAYLLASRDFLLYLGTVQT